MKLTSNTILITGGSSGIGLELSQQLLQKGNKVIICGRSKEKLNLAKKKLPKLDFFSCDLSTEKGCQELTKWIIEKHPDLNILINNAAIVHKTSFLESDDILQKALIEVETNFMAPIRLAKQLLPTILSNKNPHVMNVTTGLIYAPKADYPFYNSTKAALHSFTQVLRIQCKELPVKITEIMFPAVDTPWHQGKPPKIAISPQKAVNEMINGLEKGNTEIRIAGAKLLYIISRLAPKFALKKINNLKNVQQT